MDLADSLIVACGEPRGSAGSRWGAVYAAFVLAPIAVGATQWRDLISVVVCAVIAAAVLLLYLVRHGRRAEPEFRVTADGIWLSPRAFVPAARFVDVELRRWTVLPGSASESRWVGLSVLLDDGRELCVPSVTREIRSASAENHPVELSTDGGAQWFELPAADGTPLAWRHDTDAHVLEAIRARLDGVLDPQTPSDRQLEGVAGLVGTRLDSVGGVVRRVAPGDRSYCFRDVSDD